MNFRGKADSREPGFQITPMIDIVFLLLCFFITSQIFAQWEAEINIQLPTATESGLPGRLPGEVIINIFEDGSIAVNRQELGHEELEGVLRKLVEHFPGQSVLIRADMETRYNDIIKVLDLCRQVDIWSISFATRVPEEKRGK
ncbi:MAG: ExbD/TolR family protein [Verrucomicrobiota bacterium]